MRIHKTFRAMIALSFSLSAMALSALPSDVYVVWDVSGSMRSGGVVPEIKSYIKKDVVGAILKPGDTFSLIVFGSEARQVLSQPIRSDADKESAAKAVDSVRTDDAYTDLGMALEKLDAALASAKDGTRTPIAVFITDGKNAPPPASPYSGKDLSVDERFKDVGKRISMKGWTLYVIGVGDKTDAPAVAAAVEGSKLVESKEALKTEPLSTYVAETAKASENRAAAAAAGAAANAKAASGSDSAAQMSGGPGSVLLIAAAAAIAALFFVARSRRSKDKDAK